MTGSPAFLGCLLCITPPKQNKQHLSRDNKTCLSIISVWGTKLKALGSANLSKKHFTEIKWKTNKAK